MWKDEMGGCTRVGNGFNLAECDIDAFSGLEGIVIAIKIQEGCRGSSGIIGLGLVLGRGAVTGDNGGIVIILDWVQETIINCGD